MSSTSDPIATTQPIFDVQRARERATSDHGWLQTSHSFSFADYFDPHNVNWGALRVFNDDRIGNHGVVGPGGVQYMSAGHGVRHSEYNHSSTEDLHFLQMWVMPREMGGTPTYGQVDFDVAQRRNTWLVVASGRADQDAPVALTQDATLLVSRLEGIELRHTFEPGRLGFLFAADGGIEAAAFDEHDAPIRSVELTAGDAVRIAGVTRLKLDGAAEVVLWDLPR
jgi:redox-sensitive bicupin YhaK (pirin superfamily)